MSSLILTAKVTKAHKGFDMLSRKIGLFGVLALAVCASAQEAKPAAKTAHSIDPERSTLMVRVFRSGLFGKFGHDHEIAAPIAEGVVDDGGKPSVTLRVRSHEMKVLDRDLEPKKRADVQETMLGGQVLDSSNFPEIRFASTHVTSVGPDKWLVMGMLTLHGETHAVTLNVVRENGRFQGAATIRQTDYGITPVSVAGGTVSVKNEIKIEFDIAVK